MNEKKIAYNKIMGGACKKPLSIPKYPKPPLETEAGYALIAEKIFPKKSAIVYDLRMSKAFAFYLRGKGFKLIPSAPGPKEIKETAKKSRAKAAISLDGKFYLRSLGYKASSSKKLNGLVRNISPDETKEAQKIFKKYHKSQPLPIKVCGDFKSIADNLKRKYRRGAAFFYGKGILIEFSNWWFNMLQMNGGRCLLEMVVESRRKQILAQKIRELKSALRARQG